MVLRVGRALIVALGLVLLVLVLVLLARRPKNVVRDICGRL